MMNRQPHRGDPAHGQVAHVDVCDVEVIEQQAHAFAQLGDAL